MSSPPDMSPIQWLSLLTILVIIFEELYYAKLVPNKRLLTWVMISWLMHGVIYYGCIILDVSFYGSSPYSTWSSILRFHGYLVIAGVTYYRIQLTKLPTKLPTEEPHD